MGEKKHRTLAEEMERQYEILEQEEKGAKANVMVTVESAERKKAEVRVPECIDRHGIIRTTESLPPFRPELRMSISPFDKIDKKAQGFDKNSYEHSFIVTTKQTENLLSAVLRKAADMIDEASKHLPSKDSVK